VDGLSVLAFGYLRSPISPGRDRACGFGAV